MAVIYKFPSGEKIHKFEEEEWTTAMVKAIEQARPRAELHFLPFFGGPIIGFPAITAASGASSILSTLPPQLEGY